MALLRVEEGANASEIALPEGGEMVFLAVNGNGPTLAAQRSKDYLAALVRAGRHWIVLAAPHAEVAIDGFPVPSMKILDDQSILRVGGVQMRLCEGGEEVLGPDSPLIQQRKACPWCQRSFKADDVVFHCPQCRLAQHVPCIRRGKKCGSFPFCGYRLPQVDAAGSATR